jgi:methylated-DNA-[protein]-cysteine S-methyltransferase
MNYFHLNPCPPLGEMVLRTDSGHITGVYFSGQKHFPASCALTQDPGPAPMLIDALRLQLTEYFSGLRQHFDLPLKLSGTPFQIRVWEALKSIPYGEVVSYGDIARSLGFGSGHGRAVGAAIGRNPISILIPCHRVVGGGGALTGYAGGLPRKEYLLQLERTRLFHKNNNDKYEAS